MSTTPTGRRAWTEVRVTVPDGWGELVADLFGTAPFGGVAFGPASLATPPAPAGHDYLRAYVPSELDDEALRVRVRGDLDRLAEATGAAELADLELRFHPLPEEDWANSWKTTWRAFRCGDLAVVPRHFDGALRPTDRRLVLDPGGVFGTGRHATTRTCLKVLQERLAGGERVLDAGCGTGILAAGALLSGAASASASPPSTRAAARGAGAGPWPCLCWCSRLSTPPTWQGCCSNSATARPGEMTDVSPAWPGLF